MQADQHLVGADYLDREVPVEGGTLVARDYGGSGPDVVLIHGAGHNVAAWDHFAPLLTDQLRVVGYDVRGHGLSPLDPGLGMQAWVADLEAVVSHLGLDLACVVGHSLGGFIGLAYCAVHELTRGLVNLDGPVVSQQEAYALVGLERDLEDYRREIEAQVFVGSLEDGEAFLEEFTRPPFTAMFRRGVIQRPDGQWSSRPTVSEWLAINQATWDFDPNPLFASGSFPLLMVLACGLEGQAGHPDLMAAKREVAARLAQTRPDTETVWLDTSHFMVTDRPGQVAALVREWVGRS